MFRHPLYRPHSFSDIRTGYQTMRLSGSIQSSVRRARYGPSNSWWKLPPVTRELKDIQDLSITTEWSLVDVSGPFTLLCRSCSSLTSGKYYDGPFPHKTVGGSGICTCRKIFNVVQNKLGVFVKQTVASSIILLEKLRVQKTETEG